MHDVSISRRRFLRSVAAATTGMAAVPAVVSAPALIRARPIIHCGVASGEVDFNSAVIWSRADRRARMVVEWSTSESFRQARRVRGPWTGIENDFTAKVALSDLPPGARIFYRVQFEDEKFNGSEPVLGQFRTASPERRDVFFAWSGDTCGQGYGINPEFDGLKTYASIRALDPDFFVHSGDNIYADGPIEPQLKTPAGTIWKNITTPEKAKVAETLAEFRGNYRYNLLDAHVREFNSSVAVFSQWDDHEVLNNWFPGKILEDNKYRIKDVNVLAANARRAYFDYMPLRDGPRSRIYRSVPRGPLCELFFLDLRTYRAPNSGNRQTERSRATDYMGERQLDWLKGALQKSRAVWKVICSDMPIGLIVGDANKTYENCANGNGPALGRELEIADLLAFMKEQRIRNVFWLTADVHYAASHYYDPSKAQFTNFDGFWEFISGPLHAASLTPNAVDNTFGPQVRWTSRKRGEKASGPYTNQQFFSTVRIDAATQTATITHHDRDGAKLGSVDLPAV